jgi:hypothetical protein
LYLYIVLNHLAADSYVPGSLLIPFYCSINTEGSIAEQLENNRAVRKYLNMTQLTSKANHHYKKKKKRSRARFTSKAVEQSLKLHIFLQVEFGLLILLAYINPFKYRDTHSGHHKAKSFEINRRWEHDCYHPEQNASPIKINEDCYLKVERLFYI